MSKLNLLSIAIASYISLPALAADTPALEEIVVTAQKRVQKLEDVPISISTVSGDKLEKTGITSAQGLADYVPSFNMTQTGIGTNIAIRGISSGVNQGFEQSTAMFIDGIHYGRAQLARAPFLDIERIEVLRGPQSILFGKNSTAGAISIITAKPGDELEGSLTALYEPEYGEKDVRLVLSGPISETVSGRMAIMNRTYDGFIENTTLNRDESADKDRVVRGTLEWKPTEAWDITLKLEDGSFDNTGRNVEAIKPITNPSLNTSNDPNPYATLLAHLSAGPAGTYQLDTTQDGLRQSNGDYSYNDTSNATLTAEYDLGSLTLTSVTGYNAYTYQELCDCDFTGAPGFNILSDEDYRQTSQEIRIASSEKQTVSWLGGAFYQGSNLEFHDSVSVPTNSVIATAFSTPTSLGPVLGNMLRGASTQRDFNQDSELYAIFGQATWNMTEANRLILGARYSKEAKDADRHQYHVTPTGAVLPEGTVAGAYNIIWSQFKVDPHAISGSRDESSFTPQVTFQHDLNSHDRLYANYTTGFKSGGFDVRSNAAPNSLGGIYPSIEGTWEFQEEKVKNYEIGGKFLFADGALELNLAAFRSVFTDMQTSQFDGGLSFIVTNAGEAVVQGLEVDGRWAIMDALLMRGGASFIDFEYTKFANAQCSFGQVSPSGNGFCDQTGKSREFVPEVQGNVGWDYTFSFSSGFKLTNTLDVIYSDSYLTTPSLDERMKQSSYVKLNARIALSGINDMWEIALLGKNLTNETIITYANGLPVASVLTAGKGSGYYAFYEEPRSVAVQGTVKF
ncbi:MAG: TonB-dependent receptor [Pseudomonadota bacterium]